MSQQNANIGYLVTVPLAESIPARGDVMYLGEWCVSSPADLLTERNFRSVLPYPWLDNTVVRDGIAYTERVLDSVLSSLLPWLNKIHKRSNNEIFWKRIVGYFLRIYIHTLYDKYVCLKKAIEIYPSICTVVLNPLSFETCSTPMHFIENVRKSDLFNWQLYSQIVDFLNVKTLQLDAKSSDFRALKNKNKLIVNLKDVRHKIISSLINRGFSSDAAFYVTLFDQASSLKLTALTGFKAWPITNIDFPWKPGSEPNVEIRGSLAQLQGPDEFTNLIFRTLSQNLPTAFLEDFPAVDAFVQKRMQKKTPKAIFTGIGFLWNPVFALWAAECADKGAKIFGVQHGGTYGEVDYSYGESVERDIADKYISWGWQDGSDVEPLPSPHLVKVKAAGVPPEDRVLVVSTLDSRYAYFLSPLPFSTRFIRHFENQESFLENIDPLILKRIVFRLYPDDFGWKVRERLSNRFPDLQFDDRGLTFRESVERSKLVVFDHFGGTTFLEALSLTVPVMTFSDPELFSIRPMARKYYDALNGCGVLHYSPVEAAETLNKHFNRLDEWWENQERQQAVDDFRTRFAWQESNAIRRWAHFVRDHTGRDAI